MHTVEDVGPQRQLPTRDFARNAELLMSSCALLYLFIHDLTLCIVARILLPEFLLGAKHVYVF